MREDLKGVPDEVRKTRDDVDRKLTETVDEHPVVGKALDFRLLLIAAAVALVVAFVARIAGLGFVMSLLVFVLVFAGGWLGLARAATPRPPTDSERS